jgi:hypothetical protein
MIGRAPGNIVVIDAPRRVARQETLIVIPMVCGELIVRSADQVLSAHL